MADKMEGGCACGRVRYVASIDSDDAYLCHCRMCQRGTGSVSIAFRNMRKADVTWVREPDRYASSPIADRGFCSACGTSLTFEFRDDDAMDLTVASFDEPGRFVPSAHYAVESRLAHWRDTSGLPGYRTEDNPNVVNRWMNALGKLPD